MEYEMSYAMEFAARCNQLVKDHKSTESIVKISAYEFKKFIRTVTKELDFITYIFIDDSISVKNKNNWEIIN